MNILSDVDSEIQNPSGEKKFTEQGNIESADGSSAAEIITSTSQLKGIESEKEGESSDVFESGELENFEKDFLETENVSEDDEVPDSEIIDNFGVIVPENVPDIEDEQILEEAKAETENVVQNSPLNFDISSETAAKIEDDWQNEAEESAILPENSDVELNKSEESTVVNEESVVSNNNIEEASEESNLKNLTENVEVNRSTESSDEVISSNEIDSFEEKQKIAPPAEPLILEEDEVRMPTISYDSSDVKDIEENKIYGDNKFKSILGDTPNAGSSAQDDDSLTDIQQNDTGQRKLEELAEKIKIPESPLDETEDRDTRYDSVKIMDDEDSGFFQNSDSIKNQTDDSYTTPNFASKNDTDGKKGLKLKPLDEGTVLNNRYEIIRKIGGGGMGAVYLATDKNLGETLRAVKEMVQSYIEESQQDKAIEDFKREATILSTLDHPAIPTIYDYFYDENEGRFYLVMKYISGGDLAQRLRSASEGRLDELSVVEWAIQIADVLDYLHKLQPPIVYRDLKPANVMLDSNSGRIMLIDFGIARSINKEEKGVTAVGTMGYAPPELFSGNVEPRSDIYSLGSTIFHLLTGADPQSNPLLIFDFQKHPRPRQINPSLTDQIEKIIMRSVEYNAQNRFKSAAEMRDELIDHLRRLKTGKVSYGISESPAAAALEDQKVFCGFCGQQIVATDMFCAFCGSKQPLAQQGVHSSEYVSPLMTAKLFVVGTNDLPAPAYALEKDNNILGRRDPITQIFPEVDLSKFDPQTKISRRHARIWRENGKFLMEDLGSSNGTLIIPVVGESFKLRPHNPHNLINGEKVKVGDTTLHFVIE